MDEMETDNPEEQEGRPKSLSFLCIGTFIFTGLGALSAIVTPLSSEAVKAYMEASPDYDKEAFAATMKVIEAGWPYFLTTLLFTLGSMTGCILMWKLKKIGFHFYAFSNLVIMFVPALFLETAISWYAIFFTLTFIAFYAFHLKFMK